MTTTTSMGEMLKALEPFADEVISTLLLQQPTNAVVVRMHLRWWGGDYPPDLPPWATRSRMQRGPRRRGVRGQRRRIQALYGKAA